MQNNILVNGTWRQGGGENFESVDPSTGEVIWTGQSANAQDVRECVAAARNAFSPWSQMRANERIAIVERYRDLIKRDGDELAKLISRETGKPYWETKTEAGAVAAKVDISIRAFHERTGERDSEVGAGRAVLRHKAHGVMAVLGPYNFPAHLPNGHIVPALIAGNTIVFKPSELAPSPGAFIAERLLEAGVPEGVVNVVQGGRETGVALIESDDINGVLFTGGARTGQAIHQQFGGRPEVILALELGGNNPMIWWDTADIDAAAFAVIQSAFLSSGQRCTCARRLIIPEGDIGEAYLTALTNLMDRIRIGAPFDDPAPFMGPVISSGAAQSLERAFDRLVEQDGAPIRNLSVKDEASAFVSLGLIDVTNASGVADEEHFGPLLKVWRVADFDAAIAQANRTKFGLSAGLLSDDKQKWENFLAHSRAGVVNWNRQTTGASSAAPFGGVGQSGNHRPSAYYAADYCAYPVASMEGESLIPIPEAQPGLAK